MNGEDHIGRIYRETIWTEEQRVLDLDTADLTVDGGRRRTEINGWEKGTVAENGFIVPPIRGGGICMQWHDPVRLRRVANENRHPRGLTRVQVARSGLATTIRSRDGRDQRWRSERCLTRSRNDGDHRITM